MIFFLIFYLFITRCIKWLDLDSQYYIIVDNLMQYNPVFINSNNNRQNMGEFSKGSPAVGEAGRPPINNIFARNTIMSQNGGNPPTPQSFLNSPNNNQNASKAPPFTFSPNLPQTSGLLASSNMNIGVKNNISNPFTPANSTAFNNFGGGCAQTYVFANNSLQNGNNNTAIFNKNSNSNTVNTSFINTNQQSFAPTFTNSLTKTNFNDPNAPSSLSPMFPNSQTFNISNQNNNTSFINNNLTNPPNPFLNPISNNTTITTGSNLNPFDNPNKLMNNQLTQPNNSYNSVEITQNTQSFQSKSQINSNLQPNFNTHIQEMVEKMNINDLKTWDSPYNFFHTQLILQNIFQNTQQQEEQSYLLKKQQQMKVKDSPYKHYIIFMIVELIKALENIQEMQQRATQLNLRAEQLEQSLKNRLNAAKINFIKMLKFERMVKHIQTELNLIESELFNFLRPLLQAYQTKSYIPFEEPNDFNIEIANNIMVKIELIQKNITKIAEQSISIYDFIDSLNQRNITQAKRTISQLIIYFEDVCIQFETLKQRYESFQIVYNKEKQENYVKKFDRQVESYEISDKIITILAKSEKKIEVGFCQSQKTCK